MDPPTEFGILNLAVALERVGGDNELLEEVARLFLDSAAELLAEIRDAVVSRNAKALERAAHTLKGSVGNFAAEATFQAALKLEKMGRAGELNGVDSAFAALETEMQRLQPAIAALAEKDSKH